MSGRCTFNVTSPKRNVTPSHCGLWKISNVFEGAMARNQRSLFKFQTLLYCLNILHSHTPSFIKCVFVNHGLFFERHVSYFAVKCAIQTHTVRERDAELAESPTTLCDHSPNIVIPLNRDEEIFHHSDFVGQVCGVRHHTGCFGNGWCAEVCSIMLCETQLLR